VTPLRANGGLGRLDRARLHRLGFRGDDQGAYRFGLDRDLADAPDYLGYRLYLEQVRPLLNSPSLHAVTENKWVFYRLMAGFSVPVPPTLGLYDPVFGTTWDGDELRTASDVLQLLDRERPDGLVLKPAGGQQGYDVVICSDIDYASGACRLQTGAPALLGEVVRALPATGARGYPGHIVQRTVQQHHFLATINPHTSNTVRVMTLLTADRVVVQGAILRLGRDGNMSDNWEQGGIGAVVDLATGVLGEGVLKPKHGGQRVTRHPDTGVEFTGLRLPAWDEALTVCRRAARLLPGVRSIGWDVLITESGPVLLEANSDWDLQLFQLHTSGLLADPVFRAELEAAGVRVPKSMPSALSSVAGAGRESARRALTKVRRRS
jgi:hypothetical protein